MTASELLEQAKKEFTNVKIGQKFKVKDLFIGHHWNSIDRSTRLTLGVLFLNYAEKNSSLIKIEEKNSANQQQYSRK